MKWPSARCASTAWPTACSRVDSMKRHRTLVTDSRGRVWLALSRGISVADPATRATRRPCRRSRTSSRCRPTAGRSTSTVRLRFRPAAGESRSSTRASASRCRSVCATAIGSTGSISDWSEPTADRQTVYTNLGHGQYRFRVIASNGDGLWNGSEASLAFEIRPMLWQTRWFQAAAVVIGLAGRGWTVSSPLAAAGAPAQRQVRGASRGADPHRPGAARHAAPGVRQRVDADARRRGSAAGGLAGQTRVHPRARSDEPRDRGRAQRRPRPSLAGGEAHDLEHAFSGIQSELATGQTTAYRVIVEGKPRQLDPAVRDDVYRIGREGLVNAFRHSGATAVEIEIEYARASCGCSCGRRPGHRSADRAHGNHRPLGHRRHEGARRTHRREPHDPQPRGCGHRDRIARPGTRRLHSRMNFHERPASDSRCSVRTITRSCAKASRPSSTASPT